MKKKNKMKNKRRSKEEGQIAQIIRRKMLQKDHGDGKIYSRKNKKWLKEN